WHPAPTAGGEPVEYLVHVCSGPLDDPHRSAHGLGRETMSLSELAVELVERDSPVALGDVIEGFPDRGFVLIEGFFLRMQPPPLVESFFWRQVGCLRADLLCEKTVELPKFFGHLDGHPSPPALPTVDFTTLRGGRHHPASATSPAIGINPATPSGSANDPE